MSTAADQILKQALSLSAADQIELADRLVERVATSVSPEIAAAQVEEVRRRIAEVSGGEVELLPGEQALASVRGRLDAARKSA